jgi:hypothetical protein
VTLHVLTACTRPTNLPVIAESLATWGSADLIWHIRFDHRHEHIGGQAVKNALLDEIADGWVMFLDDDTVVHPKLWKRFMQHRNGAAAIVVSQQHSVLGILHAAHENVMIGTIDIGQVILRREVIGLHRIPETYAGDGEFLSAILPHVDAVYLDEVLSFHNALN